MKGKLALLAIVLVTVSLVSGFVVGVNVAPQPQAQTPPVTVPTPRPFMQFTIAIYAAYLNVSLYNQGNGEGIGTLTVKLLDSGNLILWAQAAPYNIPASQGQSFQFYPSVAISSAAGISVQP